MKLELEHIRKSFGKCKVLADVNLKIGEGELLLLSGPSGSGKTTLLEIAAGMLEPDGGKRTVRTNRIACAFQDDILIPWATVWENMSFVHERASDYARIEHYLGLLGLLDARDKKPAQLSGGMRRRLNLARMFSVDPELLLLDEPFSFQDETACNTVVSLLNSCIKAGAAVLVVTHQDLPRELRPTCLLAIEQIPVVIGK